RSFCLAVYWFDPLVWAAAVLSRRDCEAACDAATVQALGEAERFAYGRTLVRMVSRQNGFSGLLSTATTMTGGKKRIRERVELLARHPRALPVTLVCLAALIGILVGCTFTAAKQEAEPVTFQIEMPALVTVSRDGGHELYLRDGTLKWAAAELINGIPLLPAEEEFPFAEVTLTFEGETTHHVEFYGETLLRVDGAVYTRAEGKNDYSLIEELYGADNGTLFEAVLTGEKPFVFFNAGSKLTDLPGALSSIVEGCSVSFTTSLDLDGDGALECVLGLAPGDYGFLVLWRTGDTIYAQSFPYRGFRDLRTDGSFSYSSGAADSGIGKLRLTPSGAETEPETWSESDGTTVRFYVAGKPADEAAFQAAWDAWEALPLQMWDEVELSSLASLTDAALCAYALEADGAYAEGAGYELARRFRENPDGLAAAMEESGAPGRLALLLRSALEPGESFPLDEAKHSTIAALLGDHLTPEGVQYLRTVWTEDSEGAWVLRSRAELEARAADAPEAYDAAFFETHDLILLTREEGSGSLRHRVDEVNLSPSGYFVLRLTILTPEVGTDDMAAWQILIPVPKGKAAAPAEMPLLTVWEPME
ncbi:MAG: M56 family metallopeptidase, partial [bacterium]